MKTLLAVLLLGISLMACQSTLVPISRRPLESFRDSPQFIRKSRTIEQEDEQQNEEVFIRKQEIKIVESEEPEQSASLFEIDNPGNYLFYDKPRGAIGETLTVYVRSSRDTEEEAPPEAAENEQEGAELNPEQLEEDLLAALPQLKPGEEKPTLLTKIPFKVMRRLPNGDVLLEYFRSSKNDTESNTIKVQARLPRKKLQGNQAILTSDLKDVEWYQNHNQKTAERQSLGWEDEYTLRLSGFEEARSQEAMNLESKRQELVNLRERLRQRIVSMGKEREMISRERERITQMRNEMDQKINALERENREKDAQIEQQREVIRRQEELLRQGQTEAAGQPEAEGGADEQDQ